MESVGCMLNVGAGDKVGCDVGRPRRSSICCRETVPSPSAVPMENLTVRSALAFSGAVQDSSKESIMSALSLKCIVSPWLQSVFDSQPGGLVSVPPLACMNALRCRFASRKVRTSPSEKVAVLPIGSTTEIKSSAVIAGTSMRIDAVMTSS